MNEDLTEAIGLGHDLGHTPFGHLGEQALTPLLDHPFRHSEQCLRVVDHLEKDGAGLNLTWEVRDGILHHPWSMPSPATLEAQVVRFADRIAYVNHDVDDAIRAGVLDPEELPAGPIGMLGADHSERINTLVSDLVATSEGQPQIRLSPRSFQALDALRDFLFAEVYLRARRPTTSRNARSAPARALRAFPGPSRGAAARVPSSARATCPPAWQTSSPA